METAKKVNWTANALALVADLYDYLEIQSGEDFASNYIDALLLFGNDLNTKSEHYSFCRNAKLQARGYRCALFRKAYIVIYMEDDIEVVILGVIHVKRGPDIFEQI